MALSLVTAPFGTSQSSSFGSMNWMASAELSTRPQLPAATSQRQRALKSSTDGQLANWVKGLFELCSNRSRNERQQNADNTVPILGERDFLTFLEELPTRQTLSNRLLQLIRNQSAYIAGWDGYDAIAPSAATVNDAEHFAINTLPRAGFQLPIVTSAPDGEVNFSWKNQKGIIDLGFYGDGSYSYYAKLANGKEVISDDSSLHTPLPDEVLEIIRGN